jgi:predicted secreted protein
LALILSICILLPSQIPGAFEYRGDFEAGDGPHSAKMSDLDGDGDLDVVTADYFADTVSILINDGEGLFIKSGEYITGTGPRSLFLADVDGDNDTDIITANYQDDTASVIKNYGNGTFSSKVDYNVGYGPYSIFLADIGEDFNGDLDIVTADEQTFKVSVLENDGNGAFSNRKTYDVGAKPKGLFLNDFNGDGYNDIATANWADNSISLLINRADGTFNDQVEYTAGESPRALASADLNGDNLPDIVTANQHSDSISVLMNNGIGAFLSKKNYIVGYNPLSVFLGDIDGDGDADALTTNLIDDTISLLKNNGNGNFSQRIDYITDNGPYDVLLGDINGDGVMDIITANNYADTISVFYSNYPSSITIIEPDGINDIANKSYTITWKDFDPDEDALITLFWDIDNSGFDGTEIVTGLSEDDNGIGGAYIWNISSMPEGNYWVYARIEDSIFGPKYDYSSDALTVNHSIIKNIPPTFQIIEPDGNSDFADKEFTIIWMDSDPDDDAIISLYYDVDDKDFNGILIVEGLGEDADGGSGIYTWNTTAIQEGKYFIYGICEDGTSEPVKSYSSHPVIVNHTSVENDPPSIEIIDPSGEDNHADTEYLITWTDSDSDDDASISLFYDSNDSDFDGTLIARNLSEDENGSSGMYLWNTTNTPEGEYWIYAMIMDGISEAKYNYSLGSLNISHPQTSNIPPSFRIIEPDGKNDFADHEFTLIWIDSDPDDDALISLYYDINNSGFDGVTIADNLSEDADGNSGIYHWNTTNILEGKYYIYGVCYDGNNEAVKRYSAFPVMINHTNINIPPSENQTPLKNNAPLIQIVEPDGLNDHANTEYIIIWIDSDVDDDASISLYYDTDISGYDGIMIVSGLSENDHETSGLYIWNTTIIPEGRYFIYAVITDGFQVFRDYSPGMMTVDHSGAFNTAPKILVLTPGKGIVETDENYIIRWIDSDPEDSAFISLYYDTDQSGYDGSLIVSDLSEDDENDMFLWITKDIPNGQYYIYAKIDDGMNDVVYDYSYGKLSINHAPNEEENGGTQHWLPDSYLLILVLALFLILILSLFLWKRRGKEEEEEKMEEIKEEDLDKSDEEFERELDGELLPTIEDLKNEEKDEEEIDEELLPLPEDLEEKEP